MKFKVRIAKKSDVRDIYEIYKGENFLKGENGLGYIVEDILDYVKSRKDKFFVCEFEGKIVGSLFVQFFSDYVYIHTIVVSRKFRNKGVGSVLIEKLIMEMKKRGQDVIECFVEMGNKRMYNLMKKWRFKRGKKFFYFSKKL